MARFTVEGDTPKPKRIRERRGYIFTLDTATRNRLESFARDRSEPMSGIVEDAINAYIEAQEK